MLDSWSVCLLKVDGFLCALMMFYRLLIVILRPILFENFVIPLVKGVHDTSRFYLPQVRIFHLWKHEIVFKSEIFSQNNCDLQTS